MPANLRSLIGKLNDTARKAMEAAAGLCLARTHYDIEVEHFLLKALDSADGDLSRILLHFEIDKSRLTAELTRGLDKLKSGNARTPALSPIAIEDADGSLDGGFAGLRRIADSHRLHRSGPATNDDLIRLMREVSKEFQKIQGDALRKDFISIVAGSQEDAGPAGAEESAADTPRPAAQRQDAQSGSVHRQPHGKCQARQDRSGAGPRFRDPPGGGYSDAPAPEQSHPDGRSGRGQDRGGGGIRSADLAAGDVPPALRNVTLRSLDLALLQAGAGVKGEFENRLKGLIAGGEVVAHPDHSVHR